MTTNNDNPQHGAFYHIGNCISWVVFFSLCFAYCCRKELTEVTK